MLNYDDYMFPLSLKAKRQSGLVCESAEGLQETEPKSGGKPDAPEGGKAIVCEGVAMEEQGKACTITEAALGELICESAGINARSLAMSAALGWAQGDDHSYGALDEYVMVCADVDGDDEVSEEEEDYYNEIWSNVPGALMTMGASSDDVDKLCNGEDDAAGSSVAASLSGYLNEDGAPSDEDLIMGYAAGSNATFYESICESADEGDRLVLEGIYKRMKAFRDGKLQIIRKKIAGAKARLSAAQKAGLRKARRMANKGVAKLKRIKSFLKGLKRGLHRKPKG